EPAKEIAVRLVRSCLCKQLTSLYIGGPAATSKVFDLPDAKISNFTVQCPMGPLLGRASSRNSAEEDDADDEGSGSDEDSEHERGVVVSAVGRRLTVNQRAHIIYLHRCSPDDTEHPLHDLSYVS
ncbi:unnamed protein product, partial [Pylaiella littoralis]